MTLTLQVTMGSRRRGGGETELVGVGLQEGMQGREAVVVVALCAELS